MLKKIMLVFGTRPEAIKMCPLVKRLRARGTFKTVICVTGQHREMLYGVLSELGVTPDHDLSVMKSGQSLFGVTSGVLNGMDEILEREKPDAVLVHGDTTTAFSTALACFYKRVSVCHVEAGLRTDNIYDPYPEEFNRRALGVLSNIHFAPTDWAKENLIREGKKADDVCVTGNTVIDALTDNVRVDYSHPELEWSKGSRLVIVTAHRRENIGTPMRSMLRGIRRAMAEETDVKVICPVHMNPAVRQIVIDELGGCERIHITEPLGTVDFHNILSRCYAVLTDSGGIQEEATFLGKPVLVMRDRTERQEGINVGTLKTVGTSEEAVYGNFKLILNDEKLYSEMSVPSNVFGDGSASEKISAVLEEKIC